MDNNKGPNFDRFLMRLKDFIIIGTAVAAMANWIYKRSETTEQRFHVMEERMANVERALIHR